MKLAAADLASDHPLDDASSIVLSPEDFDRKFEVPTHPIQIDVARLSGRCGNLLVVQMKSGNKVPRNQRATLRSLGLGRRFAASLRWDDPITRGYLKAVRHRIGIVSLPDSCYKESVTELFESQQYGTPSKPGEISRSFDGEYIGFRSSPNELTVFMSTSASFIQMLAGLASCDLEPDSASSECWISSVEHGKAATVDGRFASVIEAVSADSIRRAVLPVRTYGREQEDSIHGKVIWRSNVERFNDMARVSNEIAFLGSAACIPILPTFKSQFAEKRVQAAKLLHVSVLEKGRRFGTHL